jgi:RNA polymerase sigma-70 factor, ECF subfamily
MALPAAAASHPPSASASPSPGGPAVSSGLTFEEHYRRRSGDTIRFAAAIVGSANAEDVSQEAWTKIWKAWGQADPDRLDAWTFRIVRNCCIDRLRQNDRPALPLDLVDPAGPASVEADVVERLEYDEIIGLLRSLPSPLRETIWLREIGELGYAEIAAVLDVPIGTVMSRLHNARRKLSRRLRRR